MEPVPGAALRWPPFGAIRPSPGEAAMPFWASIHAAEASKWRCGKRCPRAIFGRRHPEAHPAPLEVETNFLRRLTAPKINPFM
jgi:hypothetical protein